MGDVFKQILVNGRVQGVFFRDSTRMQANTLGLKGGVRNLRDGRVEVIVCGPEDLVQTLIKWLKIGPKHAKVTTIEVMNYLDSLEQNALGEQFEVWPTK